MKKILIIGLGSVLREDDAAGIRVIEELEKEKLPANVTLKTGDISGLDILKYFPSYDKILIVDAAEMNEEPGTIKIFDFRDIKHSGFRDIFSTHGMTLLETLTLGEKAGINPDEITIIGIQPLRARYGFELSGLIKAKIPAVVEIIKKKMI
ncbi:MAG: hydrogenase maturation protease [Candidatus Omnitrophota bacterium]